MKTITGVDTFAQLLELIARDHPDKSLINVARLIGMSEKSYFNLKNGIPPKQKLVRIIKSFMEKEYNMKLDVINGNRIKLKNIVVNYGDSSTVSVGNIQMDDRTKYLLDKIIELEKEKSELIEKLSRKKK